ncbi:MAG: VOC family protein [Hyphomicrobiales bacterium]
MIERVTPTQFEQAEGTRDWRVVGDGACAFFATGSLAESARFVQALGELPGVDDHHPDIDIRADGVTVRLLTTASDHYGMSQRDIELAEQISGAARSLGLAPDPSRVQSTLVIPGSARNADVMPSWEAALGYVRRPDSPGEDLVDPRGRGPAFWFEEMEQLRADGGGNIHFAVWVPSEQAQARVEAALAAGGRLVRDTFAPAWWTLADAAGNEVDIATIQERG